MGASSSISLHPEEINELSELTGFPRRRIALLYRRFRKLDSNNDGVIVDSDLLSIPEFAMNPLASRMVALMDKESDRTINFRSFAMFLSHFGKHKRNSDARFAFLFRLYDCDDDGKVSVDDLRKVIKMQVGDWCSAEQVDAVVQKTMAAADVDKDGALNYNDFVKAITKVGGLADVLNFRLGEDPFDDGGGDALESADIF